jgi:perosamine synthetase
VYVVRLAEQFGRAERDAVVQRLQERGIGCGRYFAPIHRQPAYADVPLHSPLPVTDAVSERTIALPFFTRLDEARQRCVAEALAEAVRGLAPTKD